MKHVGWRNEPTRHGLAARGISTRSRGIGKKAKIHAYEFYETLHPRTFSTLIYRDKFIFIKDKEYEALDQSGWDREVAYDYLNAELEGLEREYAQTGDENIKLQMDVVKQAKAGMDSQENVEWLRDEWPEIREKRIEKYYGDQMESSGRPITLGISGRGSFDGDLKITLEGAEELAPLLQSRGVAMQAWSAFKSNSGTQKINGRIKGVDVDLKVTQPGKDLYHVEGDMFYHIDRTFTKEELTGFYEKVKRLM